MSIPEVRVPIVLDRPRTICITFNALCDAEEVLGKNLLNGEIDLTAVRSVRALLWAGLRHEDPSLKLEDVGALITQCDGGMVGALEKVSEAINAALPPTQEAAPASAEGNETGSQ